MTIMFLVRDLSLKHTCNISRLFSTLCAVSATGASISVRGGKGGELLFSHSLSTLLLVKEDRFKHKEVTLLWKSSSKPFGFID